ncbi:hypothetical protein [Alterisphingorhabdus coralli]|uniref:TonB-dependent receptor n=1 Tax=Alterisphingorhabdus coralli TaxID=3071408 RepID=A0AA97I0L2_9SPHN|nr:hypothetical protein [Parasphingorhabdus sp. SCSIO 66989]WOE73880.1 hypothetical protein RB602_08360 [Parasphingorhabdus sp. SCSIO 66989]
MKKIKMTPDMRASSATKLSAKALLLAGVVLHTAPAYAQSDNATTECAEGICSEDGNVLVRIRTEGERVPREMGDSPAALQANRRVDIATPPQRGKQSSQRVARAAGQFSIDLPGGGRIWTVEDPAFVEPVLSVGAGATAPVVGGRIVEPVQFSISSNYAQMFERMEVSIYRASDTDYIAPLAVLTPEAANNVSIEWDGTITSGDRIRPGEDLIYILRVFDKEGRFDETLPGTLTLLTPQDHQAGLNQIRARTSLDGNQLLNGRAAENRLIEETIFGANQLRRRNIVLSGSRVRVIGQDIPEGMQLTIDGSPVPIDLQRRFAAEMLLPVGTHDLDLELSTGAGDPINYPLTVDVSGDYFFAVGIADVTLSDTNVNGSISADALGDEVVTEDILADGRVAFYLKAKTESDIILTAHADTRERRLENLFDNFFDEDPTDIFRRLDPDDYYPTYGDDSRTYRDIDTQGKFYLRADWKQNSALWGNYNTALEGTEFAQYNRALYGGALAYRSDGTNKYGEANTVLRAFGSETQTAPGHVELIGTGGSIYYLRHTDVLPGSERVILELRDPTTGRPEAVVTLTSGVDYEMDDMQGRLVLTRPLMQVAQQSLPTIIRDQPLIGFEQRLIVDYEYVPQGFDPDNLTFGLRGKQGIGDVVQIGGTYVEENRSGEDYRLYGADVVLRAGQGTYAKFEYARTENSQAPTFFSDNGGLTFTQTNAAALASQEGDAYSVELRANLRELGLTKRDAVVSGWYRDRDAGYSTAYRDSNGLDVREIGIDFSADLTNRLSVFGRASELERGTDSLRQIQALADWDISNNDTVIAEIRSVRESVGGANADGLIGALQYRRRLTNSLDIYGTIQQTIDDDGGAYAENDAYTIGADWIVGQQTSLSAAHTWGDRGDSTMVQANYQVSPEYSVYGSYAVSNDRIDRLFQGQTNNPGLVLGHRWQPTNQLTLYNENQWVRETDRSGIANTYGLDFVIGRGWNIGVTFQDAGLDAVSGRVNRTAISVQTGYRNEDLDLSSRLEYREDDGAEQRTQWVSSSRLEWRVNEDLRVAGRLNYANTDDELLDAADAKFVEGNLGFAFRPHDTTKWAWLGRYTYLFDLQSLGQENANFDQRSHVISTEGIFKPNANWEFALKAAHREGSARIRRGQGEWFDSAATLGAVQVRYTLPFQWEALAEYRILHTDVDEGTRQGFLVGLDRRVSDNFRIGVGYNFTDFSGDLTDLDYRYRGWFLNLVGSY